MEETVVPKKDWEVRQEKDRKARTEELKRFWTSKLLLGSRVLEKVSGITGEVYKFYDWGVEVWVRDMNNNRQDWTWDRLATRFPRKIKRYPRPFRFPREKPSEVCHCKIGRIEVEGPNSARCTRCKFLVGSESFPRRIRRASNLLRKTYEDHVVEISLTQGKTAFVSRVDFKRLSKWKWYCHHEYAVRWSPRPNRKIISMANEVLKLPGSVKVDHWDGNTLNNTRGNLRPASNSQNLCNTVKYSNNQSGYKGVSKNGRRWQAQIQIKGKKIFLGRFSTPEKAALAYDKAAIKFHKEFAKTNFFSSPDTVGAIRSRMARRKRKASHPHAGTKGSRRVGVRTKRRKEESVHVEIQGKVQGQDHSAISPPTIPQASIPSSTVPEKQKVATVSAP